MDPQAKPKNGVVTKTEISCWLHKMVDHHLFGPGKWPAEREFLSEYWRKMKEFGLMEEVAGEAGTFRDTAVAKECHVEIMSLFMGAQELWEIPLCLNMDGYLDDDEFDEIHAISDEAEAVRVAKHYVRKAYFRFFGRSWFPN